MEEFLKQTEKDWETFWKEVEKEIDEMSKPQKIMGLVAIAIIVIALLGITGCLILQLIGETSNLLKGKFIFPI